ARLSRTAHDGLKPRVLELLRPPKLRQTAPMSGKDVVGDGDNGLHVEERSVRVEDERRNSHRKIDLCNHEAPEARFFKDIVCKNSGIDATASCAAKKIGVTLSCNPSVPWWAILGSNQ